VSAAVDPSRVPGPDALARRLLTVGRHTYGVEQMTVRHWGEDARVRFGAFCSIGTDCTVFLGGNHRHDWVTTYPLSIHPLFAPDPPISGHPSTNGDVVVGSDVWVGAGVTLLSGVTVGDGAVLGAGAMVSADVPPYAVVAGNPARVVRTRFPADQVQALLDLRWWEWDDDRIRAAVPLLCADDIGAFLAANGSPPSP